MTEKKPGFFRKLKEKYKAGRKRWAEGTVMISDVVGHFWTIGLGYGIYNFLVTPATSGMAALAIGSIAAGVSAIGITATVTSARRSWKEYKKIKAAEKTYPENPAPATPTLTPEIKATPSFNDKAITQQSAPKAEPPLTPPSSGPSI